LYSPFLKAKVKLKEAAGFLSVVVVIWLDSNPSSGLRLYVETKRNFWFAAAAYV